MATKRTKKKKPLLAQDLMETKVITACETMSAGDLCDLFQQKHVHGAPVVDDAGRLLGIVCQEDILIGSMAADGGGTPTAQAAEESTGSARYPLVRDIMTSPAITATEDTTAVDLCMMMWRFRIHHIPIVRKRQVVGMVSSLDVCRAIAFGETTTP